MSKMVQRFSGLERKEIVQKSQQCLWSKEGEKGREYLVEQRKISEAIIKKFQIGYIPHYVDNQLADRIIMPLFDYSGNLVTITSRSLQENNDVLPKYWHESYQKNNYLYGLHEAKADILTYRYVIVTEGQIDTLKMHDCGFTNTVASCANKLSKNQFASLRRVCKEFIILFDTDKNNAGQIGAENIIKHFSFGGASSLPLHYRNKLDKFAAITLDEFLDPDEYLIKHGAHRLKTLIENTLHKMRETAC